MNTNINNKGGRGFALWTAVLSLLVAMVFAAPSVVFAQITGELSQDCETAMFGTEHTITAKVTDQNDVPVAGHPLMFQVTGVNPGFYAGKLTGPDGTFQFTYVGNNLGVDTIFLIVVGNPNAVTIDTTWTDNEADLCSSSQNVQVGGKVKLNPNKKGALKIAVCGTEDFEVSNVDPEKVRLAGVEPWHWKQKDSRLCPNGKDGFVDLVFKFKNREVVEALGSDLEDTDEVTLALTGYLYDGTAFGGEWVAEKIEKKGKRHGKNEQYQDFGKGKGSKK